MDQRTYQFATTYIKGKQCQSNLAYFYWHCLPFMECTKGLTEKGPWPILKFGALMCKGFEPRATRWKAHTNLQAVCPKITLVYEITFMQNLFPILVMLFGLECKLNSLHQSCDLQIDEYCDQSFNCILTCCILLIIKD